MLYSNHNFVAYVAGRSVHASTLLQHYQVLSLLPPPEVDELFGLLGDSERDGLILEHVPVNDQDTQSRNGQKRKMPRDEPHPKGRQQANKRHLPTADKENLPPTFTRLAPPAYPGTPDNNMPGPSSHVGTPDNINTPGRMASPSCTTTPRHIDSPIHMPNGGNMGSPDHTNSPDFDGFDDNYDMGAEWDDTPMQDDLPPGSVAPLQQQTPRLNLTNNLTTSNSLGDSREIEEMLEGETVEAFEERILNIRAAHLNTLLKATLNQVFFISSFFSLVFA